VAEVDAPPALVVLIDGLDEANSPGLAAQFVDFIVHAVKGLRQSRLDIRFVLTCRTGEHTVLERVASTGTNPTLARTCTPTAEHGLPRRSRAPNSWLGH
jgi:hypothetical protein